MKDAWDKALVVSQVVSLLLIPVVIAILGWRISLSVSSREVDADLTKFAISILENRDTTEEYKMLRSWALRLLESTSPVPLDSTIYILRCCDSDSIWVPVDGEPSSVLYLRHR